MGESGVFHHNWQYCHNLISQFAIVQTTLLASRCHDLSHTPKNGFIWPQYCPKKTNGQWFSMVCTLIDNNIHHHNGQNLLHCKSIKLQPQWWQISLFTRVQTMLNYCWFLNCREHNLNSRKAWKKTWSVFEQIANIVFSNKHTDNH